jgi:NAD(P)H dehydrogenase (quinone)
MKKKIFIIDAHPRSDSLTSALAQAYRDGAIECGAKVELRALRDLQFNALLDPMTDAPLEKDLVDVQKGISKSSHVVFIFPTWWTSVPALAKGFLDRTFKSGWAFRYQKGFPKGLLKGRSARIIHTCGAPGWANKWIYGEPEVRMMRDGVLKFCGFSPVLVTKFGGIVGDTDNEGDKAIEICRELGRSDTKKLKS